MLKSSIMKKIIIVFSLFAIGFLCSIGALKNSVVKTYASTIDNEAISEEFVAIGNEADFIAISNNLSGNYVLTNDIVLSGEVNIPIGIDENNTFSGVLDGADHCVKGLNITNDATTQYIGLFGYVSGEIKNLTVEGSIHIANESKKTYVGGFCGFLSGTIKDCVNNVAISTESTVSSSTYKTPELFLGGFAGCVTGKIENSVNNATIEDCPTPIDYSEMLGYVGGIVGFNENGIVTFCNNNGCVKLLDNATNGDSKVSKYYIGGISGYSIGTVTYCKNSESVAVVNDYNRISLTHRFIAGITGFSSGTVENSANEAVIIAIGAYLYVGGIVADNSGEITVCNNIGNIDAEYIFDAKHTNHSYTHYAYIAGIAGKSTGNISISYNTGNICAAGTGTANEYTAGIAGYLSASIINCYNIGGIEGTGPNTNYCGGIAGRSLGEISKCYSMGASGNTYGIVGLSDNLTPDCYHLDYAINGTFKRDVAVSCSLEQMTQQSTFTGLDFSGVWEMGKNNSHPFPVLKNNPHKNTNNTNELFSGGQGTVAEPFVVKTVEQLENIRLFPLYNFIIGNDILFDSTYNWTPIDKFDGSINGNGFSLINLSCNYSGKEAGLIDLLYGYVCNLSIKNANFYCPTARYIGGIAASSAGKIVNCSFDGKLTSNGWIGGIAGAVSGPIINCYNNGDIYGGSYCGGIGGVLFNGNVNLGSSRGSVENSFNAGTIYKGNYCGGIVGDVSGCKIKNCYNIGTVNASDYAGGIIGRYGGDEGEENNIENCYNSGQVNAKSISGGIMGAFYALANNATTFISSCYNTGNINAPIYGAIWGKKNENDLDESCYYLDNVSIASSNGNSSAKQLTRSDFRDSTCFAGFDFDKVWLISNDISDCPYPRLKANRQVGHIYGEWIEEVQATCKTSGVKGHYHCSICEKNFDTNDNILEDLSIKVLDHDLIHHNSKAATCTEKGWNEYDTCRYCDYSTYSELAAKGHVKSNAVEENRVEATCTANGHYDSVVHCSVCHEELSCTQVTLQKIGHDLVHHDGKSATCMQKGWNKYDTCSRCNYSTYSEIAAKGHTKSDKVEENRVEATCTAAGHYDEVVYCSVCEEEISRVQKVIDMLDHTETDWIVDKQATCTEPGSKHKECSVCHEHLATETIVAHGHEFGEWTTETEPTTKSEGKMTRTCERCGTQEEKIIDKLSKKGCFGTISTVGGVVTTVSILAAAVFVIKKKHK